jgi:hypothetical protein
MVVGKETLQGNFPFACFLEKLPGFHYRWIRGWPVGDSKQNRRPVCLNGLQYPGQQGGSAIKANRHRYPTH